MKNILILLISLFFITMPLFAKGSAGEEAKYESRFIVEMPTAGVIPKGTFSFDMLLFTKGGMMAELSAAPFENFNMGISYSGTNIIGAGKVKWQGIPGIHLRYRIIDEKKFFPAILIGVLTQGRGEYYKDKERFTTMSPGVFAAMSKNYRWALGTIALHGGVNYSFEPAPKNRAPNVYFGLEHSLGDAAALNLEYNMNIDDSDNNFTKSKGLLNAAIRLNISAGWTIEIQVRDMLANKKGSDGFIRYLGLEMISPY